MALVTNFATTPLTAALYLPGYQRKLEAWKRGEIRRNGTGSAIVEDHSAQAKAVGQSSEDEDSDRAFFASSQKSATGDIAERVLFESRSVTSIPDAVLQRTHAEVGQSLKNGGDLIVVGRRYGAKSSDSSSGTVGCLGSVAETLLDAAVKASVLVVQGGNGGTGG